MQDAVLLDIWETSWRVPSIFPFILGFAILGWAALSGFLAFTGSQRSGQHEIATPQDKPYIADEPQDAGVDSDEV